MQEFSGKNSGIEWKITLKKTPNGLHHALVKVGTWSAISEDHQTQEEAKEDGCAMMASMLEEILETINA
jgi:hypothetical protein